MQRSRGGRLPQLGSQVFLTDSGLETDLIFNHGVDLPEFAAFPLLDSDHGRALLHAYYRDHLRVAIDAGFGFVFEAPTWRASVDWGARVGYDGAALDRLNRAAIDLLLDVRDGAVGASTFPVSGCIGPRGDAYRPDGLLSSHEAADYHRAQIETFAATDADMVNAMTLTHAAEAQGIAHAAQDAAMPVALSFTVETDGRLPDGTSLAETIDAVDQATGGYPAYYAINCAHPSHFSDILDPEAPWTTRLRGLRANASRRSHAELDEATELDRGDVAELGAEYAELRTRFPGLSILGGCCGTDREHVASIARQI